MARPSWKQLVLLVPAGGLLLAVAVVGVAYAKTDVPAASKASLQQKTVFQYVDGSELGRSGGVNRRLVPLSQVSVAAREAVLAAEDRGFYSEPGISVRGIARALFTNLRGGDVSQGGSTITQQYAKNAFLTSQRTYSRKIKEVLIALKMTRTRSKDQILEDYLNTIYFGRGAYGIEAATETYFGGHAKDLSAAQAAVLASSVRSPSGYDPARHPQVAKDRWVYVLDGMVKKGWLTPEQRAAAKYPYVRTIAAGQQQDRQGPKGYVIDRVEDELAADGLGEQLEQGGLVVRTTLERKAQDAAVKAVQATAPAPPVTKPDPGCTKGRKACLDEAAGRVIQGALVAVRPGTGEVLAYYGGSQGNGGFDYASHASPQDPGSTMKPYVLATALQQGISLSTRFPGYSPQEFPGYPGPVTNFGQEQFGRIDLTTATAHSVNTVYMQLAQEVGPANVAKTAHAAGIGSDVRLSDDKGNVGLGIALGIYGVPVIDQANGFATFAARGIAAVPHMVLSVTQQGRKGDLPQGKIVKHRAFSSDVADDATYALQSVVQYGTASTNGQLADGRPAAGKTGTTEKSNDAWMVGFTPQVSAAVWIGRGNNQPIVDELGAYGGLTGGTAPARVWKAFMDAALLGAPVLDFPPRAYVGSDASGAGSGATAPAAPYVPSSAPAPVVTASPTPSAVATASPTPVSPSVPAPSPTPSAPVAPAPTPSAGASARSEGRSASPSPTG